MLEKYQQHSGKKLWDAKHEVKIESKSIHCENRSKYVY